MISDQSPLLQNPDLSSVLIAVSGSSMAEQSPPIWLTTDQTVIFYKYPAVRLTDVTTKQPGAAVHSCEEKFKKDVVHLSAPGFLGRRGG